MSYQDIYTTDQGDMWDGIAHKVYGDEKFCRDLLLANPAHRNTAVFEAGVELVCPDIEIAAATPLPPWR